MQGTVRKKGNRWYYSFEIRKENGKRKRIERAGGSTKKEALEALRKAISEAEVMSLTWDCIDLDKKTIKVEKILYQNEFKKWVFGPPKTHSSIRTIKIGDSLVSLLKKFHKDQKANKLRYGEFYARCDYDFVCLKENGQLLTTDSLKYLSRVVNYELVIDFKFHSLRHTHATMLLETGANIKSIQQRLGHSKLATTMDTYSHVTKKMSDDSVLLFESILERKLPTN